MGDKLTRLALAALLGGCGAAAGDGPSIDAGPISILLGSGETSFEPLTEGGTIEVYAGPQGGYHVWLSVRVTGLEPGDESVLPSACQSPEQNDNPCIEFVVRDPTVPEPLDFYVALHLPLQPGPIGTFELSPPRLVQLDIGGLSDIEGHTLEIHTQVTDRLGHQAEATLAVTAVGVPLGGP